ncbi:hypothetical protein [Ruminococcus albus]|nr:hypothetical protein [Ruminococcus albus]
MSTVTDGNDLTETVSGITTKLTAEDILLDGSTVTTTRVDDDDIDTINGRATKWEGRDMALVVYPDTGTFLPQDAKLIVKVGSEINNASAAGAVYHLNSDGKFIIPLGAMTNSPYDDVEIALASDEFPMGETTYSMIAELMASNSLEEVSPMNGTLLAYGTLTYKASPVEVPPPPPSPSLKITSSSRTVAPGENISFDVKTINSTLNKITAVIYQKGSSWDNKTIVMNEDELKDVNVETSADAASPTNMMLSFTAPDSSEDKSYMLVVYVKDSNDDIVMTVPYYFLAVYADN